ncbi:hypothetical protein [Glutamicibacter nicotianae]|nr:hypothetical protein [Glutamicibacter nicotianae]
MAVVDDFWSRLCERWILREELQRSKANSLNKKFRSGFGIPRLPGAARA